MAIVAERGDTLAQLRAAEKNFVYCAVGGIVIALLIAFVPKPVGIPLVRLGLAVIFFASLATAAWSLGSPLSQYLRARIDLAFEDAGMEIRAAGHAVVDATGRLSRPLAWLLLGTLGFIAGRVLAEWPIGRPLLPLAGAMKWAMWFGLACIPVHLALSTNRIIEVLTLSRALRKQLLLSGFQAVTKNEAILRLERRMGPPMVVTGRYAFMVGGVDWEWADFQKNAVVFGETGSGKTVTVLNSLLVGLTASADGRNGTLACGGLLLDPKGDYLIKITGLLARQGRVADLRILNPDDPANSARYNPFDTADDALEIAERFASILSLMGMKNTNETFWIDSAKLFIRHAVGLLRGSRNRENPPSFAEIAALAAQPRLLEARLFVLAARAALAAAGKPPTNDAVTAMTFDRTAIEEHERETKPWSSFFRYWDAMSKERWQEAAAVVKSIVGENVDVPVTPLLDGTESALAVEYMTNTWLKMPEKTRGSVQAYVIPMIDPFLVEPFRTVFSGRSTINFAEALDRGQIVYVYMPRDGARSAMSPIINTLMKLDFYKAVLARVNKPRPSFFLCDEFQAFFTADAGKGDGAFFERSRQSFHVNVVATQNVSGLLRQVEKPEIVDNFLGNCTIKVFLRNTEGKTNEYASKNVFGEYAALVVTAGRSLSGKGGRDGFSDGASLSEQVQRLPRIPPEKFSQLGVPDRNRNIDYAEAIVHMGSRGKVEMHRLFFKVNLL